MFVYHNLQALSGMGDRLFDLWAVKAVARLRFPKCVMDVLWSPGLSYPGFTGNYDTNLFYLEGCRFVDSMPHDARKKYPGFCDFLMIPDCWTPLQSGYQVKLRRGSNWSNSAPQLLYEDRSWYGLDDVPLAKFFEAYREAARNTFADSKLLEKHLPDDIGSRIGIHIRLQDKIEKVESPFGMAMETWKKIESKTSFYVSRRIEEGNAFFVCSDDPEYKAKTAMYLRSRGADVVTLELQEQERDHVGLPALADLFALSRCKSIIQMTKYSTYSMAAAMIGDTPIHNVYRAVEGEDYRLNLWRPTLGELLHA